MIYKFALVVLVSGVLGLSITNLSVDPEAGIERQSGSLRGKVAEVVGKQLEKESNGFKVPSKEEQSAWSEILGKIFEKRVSDAITLIEKNGFPYKLVRFADLSTKKEYILLEEVSPRRGWGFYAFRIDAKKDLVVEAPHPISDANSEHIGIDTFLETGAKAYILSGGHRHTNDKLSSCTQASERSRYAESDPAHNTETMFHVTHVFMFDRFPESVTIQIHGMRNRDSCPNVFLSTGTKDVTTNSKRLLECLGKKKVESGIFDGKTSTCILVARTNVQGRYSNGKKDKACTEYAETSPEPGRFIHIEQEPNIRSNRESWKPVVEAMKCAFGSGD